MFLILTHLSISPFQTQNRKNRVLHETFFLSTSVLETIDLYILYLLYMQNSTDEILCILSQVWVWSIWHLPYSFKTKVTFGFSIKRVMLRSWNMLVYLYNVCDVIEQSENLLKIMATWVWDMALLICQLELHLSHLLVKYLTNYIWLITHANNTKSPN